MENQFLLARKLPDFLIQKRKLPEMLRYCDTRRFTLLTLMTMISMLPSLWRTKSRNWEVSMKKLQTGRCAFIPNIFGYGGMTRIV